MFITITIIIFTYFNQYQLHTIQKLNGSGRIPPLYSIQSCDQLLNTLDSTFDLRRKVRQDILSGGNSKRFGSEINKFDAFEPEAVCLTDERFGSIERYNAFGDGKCVVYHNRTYDIHPIFIYLTLYLSIHHYSLHSGPKFVCGADTIAAKSKRSGGCLVYSVGSNNQVDFERGVKQFM